MRRRGIALVLSAGLLLAPVLAGCGGGGGGHRPSSSPKSAATNPLTGEPGRPSGPVLGIKVDDTAAGRPQFGLGSADLVYVESAEGGLTRLIAIYASHRPGAVGPVRSVRSSDPEILGPFGPMALGFSGGSTGVLDTFGASALVDASVDAHPKPYHRESGRRAPYNLVVDVGALSGEIGKLGKAAGVRDIGLHWASHGPSGSAPRVSRFTVTMGNTRVEFGWDSSAGRWVRRQDGRTVTGADGKPVTTGNVLVQFCSVTPDFTDIDQAGHPAPFTHAVGSGRAVLFRDGRMIEGTWRRASASDRTRYTDRDGAELALRPGGAWVVLAPTGSPLDTG
ncbi:MAG TPA: DUF3048 domain-containing protein [Mycobacteriales bacterium]|nr:DUF3048 domain-containing protein [Mycobacteriales bacterium]